MTEPEFSVEKFREILKTRLAGKELRPGMGDHPFVYWEFYVAGTSPLAQLFEPSILAMSDDEIMEAYAKWRIET